MTDNYSPRQLCALLWASLCAPLVTVCSDISWPWVLLGAAGAGVVLLPLGAAARGIPDGQGAADLLEQAWGRAGKGAALLSWGWLVLGTGLAASMAVTAFPREQAFPLIPLVLLLLAAVPAAKGPAAACRFGATLFLAVAPMMLLVLLFGLSDVQMSNLSPAGRTADAVVPMSALLVPGAAFFLRDRLVSRPTPWFRWLLLAAALAAAVSVVCVGGLGLPLAQASTNAFWLMSRSISVLGVMERFESVVAAFMAVSFCCLCTFLLSAGQRALCGAAGKCTEPVAAWTTAAAAAAALWVVPRLPAWAWFVGNLLFWGCLPLATLSVVLYKKNKKI